MRGLSKDEALDYVSSRLKEVGASGGRVAALVSPHLTNEDYLLTAKLMKDVMYSEYMDYRLYGGEAYPEKPTIISLDDVEKAESYLVVGEDLSLHHPVLGLNVAKGCQEGGASLYLLVTADSFLPKFSTVNANPLPGYEEKVLEAVLCAVKGKQYDDLLKGTGVSQSDVDGIAKGLKDKKPLLIGGSRLTPKGRSLLRELREKVNGDALFLDWGGNPKGAFQMGLWSSKGETVKDILEKCVSGEIKALIVSAMDLFRDYPDGELVRKAFSNLEFLVVHDMFFTETVAYADCFLPAASFAEDGGTVLNLFWELQKRKRAFKPKGDSMPLWEVVVKLSNSLGKPVGDFESVDDITPLVEDRLKEKVEASQSLKGVEGSLLKGYIPALFEYPFYKSGFKADFCNAFVNLASEPSVTLHPEHAEELTFKSGDMVIVEVDDLQFRMKLLTDDAIPRGGALVSLGFADFPVTRALKGLWYRGVDLRAAKE